MARKQTEEGFLAVLRGLRPLLLAGKWSLVAISAIAIAVGFCEAAVLVLTVRLAFAISSNSESVELSLGPFGDRDVSLPLLFVGALALGLVRTFLQVASGYLGPRLDGRMQQILRDRAIAAYLHADWPAQAEANEGQFMEFATTQVGKLAGAPSTFGTLLTVGFYFLTLVVSAVLVEALAAVVITIAVGVLFVALRPVAKFSQRWSARSAEAGVVYSSNLLQMMKAAQELKVLHVQEPVLARGEHAVHDYAHAITRGGFLTGLTSALYQGIALILVLLALAAVAQSGAVPVASLGSVVLLLFRALSYSQTMQNQYQSVRSLGPYVERVNKMFDALESARDGFEGVDLDRVGDIRFDDVSFSYEPDRPVLDNVTFHIRKGECIGIVGASGAGKSTLIQLMLRLRRPTAGRVMVGEVDLATVSSRSWFRRAGLVPQDPILIDGTIAENLRLFREGIANEEVVQSAKDAHLFAEIQAWPQGFETTVGPRDKSLSGGQRQRLALARALAGHPDLLILDEPTSALDMRSERAVHESLEALRGDVTLIIVAHRISTLSICDRIMVLEHGRVAHFLPPNELRDQSEYFRDATGLAGVSIGGRDSSTQ